MSSKTRFLAQFSILLALEAIFCFTPLGSLPAIGPIVATLGMIPVIVTAVLLGTGAGTLMGAFAGLFSLLVWTFMTPNPLVAFAFTPAYPPGNFFSLVICFVPRALVGTVTGLVFRAFAKLPEKRQWLRYALAGFLGSFTNTVGVLGGIALFFGEAYAGALGAGLLMIIGITVLTSGIPEAIISAVVGAFVCRPLKKALGRP